MNFVTYTITYKKESHNDEWPNEYIGEAIRDENGNFLIPKIVWIDGDSAYADWEIILAENVLEV